MRQEGMHAGIQNKLKDKKGPSGPFKMKKIKISDIQFNFYVKITKSCLDIRQNLESFNLKARRTEHLYQLMQNIRAIAGYF